VLPSLRDAVDVRTKAVDGGSKEYRAGGATTRVVSCHLQVPGVEISRERVSGVVIPFTLF
jgi:hypothetical protein